MDLNEIKNLPPIAESTGNESNIAEVLQAEVNATPPAEPVKPKRGRPKKSTAPAPQAEVLPRLEQFRTSPPSQTPASPPQEPQKPQAAISARSVVFAVDVVIPRIMSKFFGGTHKDYQLDKDEKEELTALADPVAQELSEVIKSPVGIFAFCVMVAYGSKV